MRVNVVAEHIELDGHALAMAARTARATVEAGRAHRLRVTAAGYHTALRRLLVEPEGTVEIAVSLAAIEKGEHAVATPAAVAPTAPATTASPDPNAAIDPYR